MKVIVNNVVGHRRWLRVQNPFSVLCLQAFTGLSLLGGVVTDKLTGTPGSISLLLKPELTFPWFI